MKGMAARIGKDEKQRRVNELRKLKQKGATTSDCYVFAAERWGIASRTCDAYLHEVSRQIYEDFNRERPQYTAELLEVLHALIQKAHDTNQMGAAVAAVTQAMKLAKLDQ